MTSVTQWFVIINPTSGSGSSKKKWPQIKSLLSANEFQFEFAFTEFNNHSTILVQNAINQGFRHIICIGGDGTIHNVVNGIMSQSIANSSKINVGVIPIGTGNDWVKTHDIPNDIEQAIQVIKNGFIKTQDVGSLQLSDNDISPTYFINLAGVGFDGYVVSKVGKYKKFGAIAYLLGAVLGLFSFRNFKSKTTINSQVFESKTLMILIGICNYSGGGMQLTKSPNPFDGLFDISIAKDLSKVEIIRNITKLFNGSIVNYKKVDTFLTNIVDVKIDAHRLPFIQADGELIGTGSFEVTLINKAFSFYCNKKR